MRALQAKMIKYTKCYYPLCEQCGYNDCVVEHPHEVIARRKQALEDPEAYRAKQEEYNAHRREIARQKRELKNAEKEKLKPQREQHRKEVVKMCNARYNERLKTDNELAEKNRQYHREWGAKNKERISKYNRQNYLKKKAAKIDKNIQKDN